MILIFPRVYHYDDSNYVGIDYGFHPEQGFRKCENSLFESEKDGLCYHIYVLHTLTYDRLGLVDRDPAWVMSVTCRQFEFTVTKTRGRTRIHHGSLPR
jgi:hypothetical protein